MLIEALTSIAIFSIGILGLIGLQSAAIKNAGEARQRAVAAFYANQIIGQMWADPAANLSGYRHNPENQTSGSPCGFAGAASLNANVVSWISAMQEELNGLTSSNVQIKVGGTNIVNVTLCWKNPEEEALHWFTTAAQIRKS